jgi:ribonuclease D
MSRVIQNKTKHNAHCINTHPHFIKTKDSMQIWTPTTHSEIIQWMNTNHNEIKTSKYIGFDIEWKPNFYKYSNNKISVIQCATSSSAIVIQTSHFKNLPKQFIDLLQSHEILKVGCGVYDDLEKLHHQSNIPIGGYFDCGFAALRLLGLPKFGLSYLMKHFHE